MEFGRDPNPLNQFRYTFENKLEKEMTSAKHASQATKIELGRAQARPKDFGAHLKTNFNMK